MGVKSVSIKLEPHKEIYFPGQHLTGSIYADVSSNTSCRAVELQFLGRATVQWVEHNGNQTTVYSATEDYFNFKINKWMPQDPTPLLGPKSVVIKITSYSGIVSLDESGEKLPSGNHIWPFDFELPKEIPSSFQGQHGSIRYSIKAKVDIPFRIDPKHEIPFCVNCPFDLNFSNKAKAPLKIESSNTSCCCFCLSNGPVSMNISSRRSGAVIGETLKVDGEICNEGSESVEKVTVTLYQTVVYRAKGRSNEVSTKVSSVEKGSISEGDTCYLRDVAFLVPPVVPGLHFCNIMDVSYQLKVEASFGWCRSVSDQGEVFVGTVPFFVDGGVSGHSGNGVQADDLSTPDSGYSASSVENTYSTPSSYLDQQLSADPSSSDKSNFIHNSNPAPDNPYSSETYSSFSTSDEPSPYSIEISTGVKKNSVTGDTATLPPSSKLYPNRRPPVAKPCWFYMKGRSSIDEKNPPPMYLSYEGCI